MIDTRFILVTKVLWHLVDNGMNVKTAAWMNEIIQKNRLGKA